jgi:hypothetical protein
MKMVKSKHEWKWLSHYNEFYGISDECFKID